MTTRKNLIVRAFLTPASPRRSHAFSAISAVVLRYLRDWVFGGRRSDRPSPILSNLFLLKHHQ
jgi:hypothetical protein